MKALARILAFSTVKNLRILRRAWSLNEAFLHRFSMCFLNLSWLSITIPRSLISLELLISFPLIFKTKGVFCLSPRIINWYLIGFAFRELAWNQLSTFSRPYLRFEKIVSNFSWLIVGNYTSYTKSDPYETVITNFLGQPLPVKCGFWVGLACCACLWNGLNSERRELF